MFLKFCSSVSRQTVALNQLNWIYSRNFHTTSMMEKSIRISDLPPKRKSPWVYQRRGPGVRGDPRKKIQRLDPDLIGQGIFNVPFDPKHGHLVSPKEVHPSKFGGSKEIMVRVGRDTARYGHPPGYYDKEGKFVLVQEMIPEFVVPDLAECDLRPYVSYALEEEGEPELTPIKLFKDTYGADIIAKRPNMTPKDLDIYLDEFIDKHTKMWKEREEAEQQEDMQSATT